jgi:hypothetical protein
MDVALNFSAGAAGSTGGGCPSLSPGSFEHTFEANKLVRKHYG